MIKSITNFAYYFLYIISSLISNHLKLTKVDITHFVDDNVE